jgi:hypothetical protein
MSNLRLIDETTVSSSVSTVTVTDVFSSDFDVYKIVTTLTSGGDGDGSLQYVNDAGTVLVDGTYDYALHILKSNTGYFDYKGQNQTTVASLTYCGDEGGGTVMHVFNPFSSSSYTYGIVERIGKASGNLRGYKGMNVYKNNVSVSGFKFTFDVNATGGLIRTYGIRVGT